jgi:mannose-6-phosphate isomerase-like protein (cupin superfamily)
MYSRKLKECRKFKGGDGTILRELLNAKKGDFKLHYSLAHAIVKPGRSTKPHRLKGTEVYYILKGKGIMYINKERSLVSQGYAIYIPPKAIQYIKNIGNSELVFLCIVDPAWSKEKEEVLR